MKHTLQVFVYELRRNLRRKGYLFTTFGLPLLGMIGMWVVTTLVGSSAISTTQVAGLMGSVQPQSLTAAGIVDQSGLITTIPADQRGTFRQFPDADSARAALEAGEIQTYFVFPDDYLDSGDVVQVLPSLNLSSVTDSEIFEVATYNLTRGVDPLIAQRMITPAEVRVVNVSSPTPESTFDTRFLVVYVFALVLLISLFLTNGYLMQSVIEEKESRLIEILLASVRPMQLLGGKILALGLLGLFQLLVWVGVLTTVSRLFAGEANNPALGVLALLANLTFPTEILPLLLIYFVLAYVMFAALYAAVGALSSSMREGPQYAVIFTLPAVAPLWFLSLFAADPNGTVPLVMSFIPITAPLAMTSRLVATDVPAWQIALSLALLALGALGAMWFSSRLFRVQTLLAGQFPRLKDLPGLLRG
jgi:ABC-2 type transport system permease protein